MDKIQATLILRKHWNRIIQNVLQYESTTFTLKARRGGSWTESGCTALAHFKYPQFKNRPETSRVCPKG